MDPWDQLLDSYPTPSPSPPLILRAIYAREAKEARRVQGNNTAKPKNWITPDSTLSSLTTLSTGAHNNCALTGTTCTTPSASAHRNTTPSQASLQQTKQRSLQLQYLERLTQELVRVSRPLNPLNAPEARTHAPVQNVNDSPLPPPRTSPSPYKSCDPRKCPRSPEAVTLSINHSGKKPRTPTALPVVIDLTQTDSPSPSETSASTLPPHPRDPHPLPKAPSNLPSKPLPSAHPVLMKRWRKHTHSTRRRKHGSQGRSQDSLLRSNHPSATRTMPRLDSPSPSTSTASAQTSSNRSLTSRSTWPAWTKIQQYLPS